MRRLLAVAACALWATTACRPDVETQVRCGTTGDLACPSGYHCGAAGVCVAGEAPPAVSVREPAEDAVVRGVVAFEFSASSPLGLGTVTARIEPRGGGQVLATPELAEEFATPEKLSGTFRTQLTTWELFDGAYELVVEAAPARAGAEPTTLRHRFAIENGATSLAFTSPEEGVTLKGQVEVRGTVSSLIGILGVEAKVSSGSAVRNVPATMQWRAAGNLAGDFRVVFDSSTLPEGEAVIEIRATDVAQHIVAIERRIELENTALAITSAETSVTAPFRHGELLVRLSKGVPERPTVVATGIQAIPRPVPEEDGLTFKWELALSDGISSDVSATIVAIDRFGVEVEREVTLPVDVVPPAPVGEVHLTHHFARPSLLAFTCSEDASYRIGLNGGGMSAGDCAAGVATTVELPANTQGASLRLGDAHGNERDYPPTLVTAEIGLGTETSAVRLAGQAHFEQFSFNAGLALSDPKYSAADGTVHQVSAAPGTSGSISVARVGPLRATTRRVIAYDEGAANVRFAVVEGTDNAARLDLWELRADGAADPLGSMRADATFRPAWDPVTRAWVTRSFDRIELVTLTSVERSTSVPREFTPDHSSVPKSATDSIVCGRRFVGLRVDYGASPPALVSLSVDLEGFTAATLPVVSSQDFAGMVRLTCDGDNVVAIASTPQSWRFFRLTPAAASWAAFTPGGTLPPVRTDFCTGRAGHFGGGIGTGGSAGFAGGVFRIANNSVATLVGGGQGPKRAACTIVNRQPLGALGGLSEDEVGLFTTAANGWADPYLQVPYPYRHNSVYDFARNALVLVDPNLDGAKPIWEWTSGGWKASAAPALAGTHGPALAYIPGATPQVLIAGGMKQGMGSIDAHLWNGTTLARTTSLPIAVSGGATAASLADGRVVLVADTPLERSTSGTWRVLAMGGLMPYQSLLATAGDTVIRTVRNGTNAMQQQIGIYDELALGAGELEPRRHVEFWGSPMFTVPLPWRSVLYLRETTDPRPRGIDLETGGVASSGLPWELSPGDTYLAPPPAQRAMVLSTEGFPANPLVEVVDEPRPMLRARTWDPGTYKVSICARSRYGTIAAPEILVYVRDAESVRRIAPAGAAGSCERYSFELVTAGHASIELTTRRAATDATATLDVDEFVVTQDFRPTFGP